MADVERQVKIAFEGDDRIGPVIDTINGKIDGFASSVRGVTEPLSSMASAVLKVEGALAALAIGGLVYAFNKSKEFESATIELQKVIGDEANMLGTAQEQAITLSDTYGESAQKILMATADWVQAGFNVQESMNLTKAAMDLVIAGSLDSSQATEILIGTLKGFKAPAEDAARIVDILNEVSNKYATDVQQLGIGMAQLSPIAHLMGMSFEETAGILTPVIEVFRDGGEAATALKTGLLRIVDDRRPTLDTLAAIGVSQRDLNGELRSGKDILLDVAAAFQRLTPEQQIYHAQNLVGIEQAGRMVEVLANLTGVTEITNVALGATGSAAQEVAIRLQSAEVSINRFKVGFENLAIIVGDQFRLAAKEAVDGGTAIELALRNAVSSGSFQPIFDVINEFSSDIGATLRQVAQNLPEALANVDFSAFLNAIRNLGGEFQQLFVSFFGEVDLTTAEGLQAAIQKVVDGLTALTNVAAGIMSSWQPFVSALGTAATEFARMSPDAQEAAGQVLGFGQAIDSVLSHVGAVTGAINLLGGAIGLLGVTQIPGAIAAFQALGLAGGAVAAALTGVGAAAAAVGVSLALDAVLSRVIPGFEALRDTAADTIATMHGADVGLDDLTSSAAAAGAQATETAADVESLVKSLFEVPEEKQITFDAIDRASPEFQEILKQVQEIPLEKTTTVTAQPDMPSIEQTKKIIITELPEGVIVLTQTNIDQAALDKTKDALDKTLPSEKIVQAKLEGEIDVQLKQIETQARTLQTAMEWKAKVDIAEIEQVFETVRNQSDNITQMFENTGDVLTGLASSLGDISGLAKLEIFELMEQESKRRDQLLLDQQKLTEAQVRYLDARAKAMQSGQGIITIEAGGLQPELELVLQRIIELAQIRANEEGLNFLLGVT